MYVELMSLDVQQVPADAGPIVVLTDKALEKALAFIDAEVKGEGVLRLGVRGGGCSGFQYQLSIDHPRDGDISWRQGDLTVACDPDAVMYLRGATLDFKEGLMESGFEFDNPNATSACGCGSSFRVDDQAGCDSELPEGIYSVNAI